MICGVVSSASSVLNVAKRAQQQLVVLLLRLSFKRS